MLIPIYRIRKWGDARPAHQDEVQQSNWRDEELFYINAQLDCLKPEVSGAEEAKKHGTDESPIEMGRANLAASS